MRRVDLAALATEANTGAPIVVLREHDEPHRLLPIFIGGAEAAAIAIAASGHNPGRPLTHDLIVTLVASLEGSIDAVEITDLSDGSFLANLALNGPNGEQRVDTRPSDAIALAMRVGAPLFVSEAVLDAAGSLPEIEVDESDDADGAETVEPVLDEEAIDEVVEQFRSFLDDVDPARFAGPG